MKSCVEIFEFIRQVLILLFLDIPVDKTLFLDSESTSNTAVTSATSTASSDMVLEGGSKDGLSDNDNTLPDEFDDSPLLFPE